MWTKNNQNIFDLAGDLDKLKDYLRENKDLRLDTSFIPSGLKVSSNTNNSNAWTFEEDIICANDCWLCDGVWNADRYWYSNCKWKTI